MPGGWLDYTPRPALVARVGRPRRDRCAVKAARRARRAGR